MTTTRICRGRPPRHVDFTVWIPPGVKTVCGAMCNPFSKGDAVSGHWQAMCKHWQFAYLQTDFDAVKKDEFGLLKTALVDLAKKTGHPEIAHMPLCLTGMSRGGGWSSDSKRARSAARIGRDPLTYRGAYLGFRVAAH